MLSCTDLAAAYGRHSVLERVAFAAKSGEITAIIGPNGSGKSTLLGVLAGSRIPSSGSIFADGRNLVSLEPRERAKLVALMPQTPVVAAMTVRELVECGRRPYVGLLGRLSERDLAAVGRALERTSLEALAERSLASLSGGELRRAWFALLLAREAANLLLDEPFANLDPRVVLELCAILRSERDSGRTIVAVLHDVNLAFELADRVVALDGGRVCFDGTPSEAVEVCLPERLFGLRRVELREGGVVYF